MKPHVHIKTTVVDGSLEKVFGFFSNAENLNKLTPSALNFKIVTPLPLKMEKGTIIDYKLKLSGLNINWRSIISKWDPPFCFEDTQVNGPYKVWIHEHKFEEMNGSTLMTDTIQYLSPGGIFEFIPHNLFVRKKVESIFDYREQVLKEIFMNP